MNDKVTGTRRLNSLEPIFCPQTGKRIVAERHQRFEIPNGQVTWFHCEACQGWHTIITNVYSSAPELHLPHD